MALQIHITAGSRKGQRLLAGDAPLSFGRDADNALVVDLAQVSRRHGELVPQPDGSWLLVNHSPNGTRLDGKSVTTKPRAITGEMSVRVGDAEIMRVVFQGETSANTPSVSAMPEAKPVSSGKGGIKLWAGIIVGVSSLIILFMILAPIFSDRKDAPESAQATREFVPWTDAQVGTAIESMAGGTYPQDLARYEAALRVAHGAYAPGRPMRKDAWLEAYRAYREAARHNGGEFRDIGDTHDFRAIVGEAEKAVLADYHDACLEYNRRNYRTAGQLFGKMRDYAGGPDPLFGKAFRDHVLKLKSLAETRQKK